MSRHRLFIPQTISNGEELCLDGEQGHYLSRVLRLKPGSEILLFDGSGYEYPSLVTEVHRKRVLLQPGTAVRFLPMICQHCGNAPCEPVCPVFATYHTPEGVNVQIYNRCVGTRYCANNCPYKVRVYNWYRYTEENVPEPMNWQWNPDVTVRGNGIMEKCSFCMQRIRQAENRAALEEGRDVRDGEIVPACQQSCPAEAIVFGNVRDPSSWVSEVLASERTYRVLDEFINTQPAVNYLKKVTFHEVSGGHE
jgi:molybdopterin-containing oxidoreductase family iron-sulfur binding subunit